MHGEKRKKFSDELTFAKERAAKIAPHNYSEILQGYPNTAEMVDASSCIPPIYLLVLSMIAEKIGGQGTEEFNPMIDCSIYYVDMKNHSALTVIYYYECKSGLNRTGSYHISSLRNFIKKLEKLR